MPTRPTRRDERLNQLSLPFAKNSPTSKAAAISMRPFAPNIREQVFDVVMTYRLGNGSTCDEVEVLSKLSHQTVSARIRELFKAGRIRDSGRTRKTRSNRSAIVWVTSQ